MIYYAKSTGGFYSADIHGDNIPADAVEITDEQHTALLEAQSSGKAITAGPDDSPIAVDPLTLLTLDQVKSSQITLLSSECQAAIIAGFTSLALGSAYNYPAKITDQQNLAAAALDAMTPDLPSDWTTPFWCEAETGAWAYLPHTPTQILQVSRDGRAAITSALRKNQLLAADVLAAADKEAVAAIVWASA